MEVIQCASIAPDQKRELEYEVSRHTEYGIHYYCPDIDISRNVLGSVLDIRFCKRYMLRDLLVTG